MPTQPHAESSKTPLARGEAKNGYGNIFQRLWSGQLPLWDAFWTFYVLGQVLAFFVGASVGGVSAAAFGEERAVIVFGLFTLLVPGLYLAFAGVGVWRSASRRGVLGMLARVVVLAEFSAWLFVMGGLLLLGLQGREL